MADTTETKPATFLDGLTREKCAAACNVDRCVISGINVCAHPNKGGLHDAIGRRDVDALARYQQARVALALPAAA